MPKPSTTARSRRDEVLSVAARLFNQKGYPIATLEDVGDELGFTRAALYYYFKNKQEILVAITDQAAAMLKAGLHEALAGDLAPRERLRRILTNHITVINAQPDVFGVFLNEIGSLPTDVQERMLADEREYVTQVTDVLEAGIKGGEFKPDYPPRVTVLLLLGMASNTIRWFHGAGTGAGPARRGLDAEQLADVVCRMAFDGLGA